MNNLEIALNMLKEDEKSVEILERVIGDVNDYISLSSKRKLVHLALNIVYIIILLEILILACTYSNSIAYCICYIALTLVLYFVLVGDFTNTLLSRSKYAYKGVLDFMSMEEVYYLDRKLFSKGVLIDECQVYKNFSKSYIHRGSRTIEVSNSLEGTCYVYEMYSLPLIPSMVTRVKSVEDIVHKKEVFLDSPL